MQGMARRWRLFLLLFLLMGSGAGQLCGQEIPAQSGDSPAFSPFLVAIPGSGLNEQALIISAGGVAEQPRPVYVNADQGPTSHKHSYAMAFDSNEQSYRYTLDNFFVSSGAVAGTVEITTTGILSETISGGERHYERWPLLHDEAARLNTENGLFTLSLDKASFDADLTHLLVIESAAPVLDPPGYQGLNVAYTLWASGAVNQSRRPYLLILTYLESWLGGREAQSLRVFWYDGFAKEWVEQAAVVHSERNEVVLATTRLGTFRLFAANRSLYLPVVNR